ncbi:MAG: response regulator [Candidatus Latescibacteria bacterium]|jgi:DNA-binding NtrC family response regulator|nr:response regulator [Candidatus Latescibacterota bacterium]
MPRVLIVDDDPSIRQVLHEIVTIYGYDCETAESAKEGISLLAQKRIDLVMLDLQMPDITGEQFLDFIRKKGIRTPVVVVSAHVDKDIAKKLGEIGINGIITKPFEVDRVIDVMNRALGKDEIHGGSR